MKAPKPEANITGVAPQILYFGILSRWKKYMQLIIMDRTFFNKLKFSRRLEAFSVCVCKYMWISYLRNSVQVTLILAVLNRTTGALPLTFTSALWAL
jgi:hypothetical protein